MASNTSLLAEVSVDASFRLDARQRHKLDGLLGGNDGDILGGFGGIDTLGSGEWQLLVGQNDQSSFVLQQALLVGSQRFLAAVLAAVVDGNTNGSGELAGDAGSLEFLQGKAAASSDLQVVLDGGATDDRAESISGARAGGGSLLGAGDTTGLLLAGLVEPGLDATLPLLVEVSVGDDVVVLHGNGLGDGWIDRDRV